MQSPNDQFAARHRIAGDLRSTWQPLVLTAAAFKVLAFVVLTPLLGVLFRALIGFSGRAVLSDVDMVLFFLGPAGWFTAIVAGGTWLAITALEQAALTAIVCARQQGTRLNVMEAVRFAAARAWPVLRLAMRVVALLLIVVAPFLVGLAAAYAALLTEFDINFYLRTRPVEFQVAVGIGVGLGLGLAAVLLRLATSWFFALPLVVFENVPAADALRRSAERATGHRRRILAWVAGWAGAVFVTSSLVTGVLVAVARATVPGFASSLHLLVVAIGTTLLLWTIANVAINVLATTTFSVILFDLYRVLVREDRDVAWVPPAESAVPFPSLSRTRVAVLAAVALLAAIAIGVFTLHGVRLEDDVEVMAHRGASAEAPENTLAAIERAIDAGADWVEIDVQETADGEVVVFHDSDFMKLADTNLKIWDATLRDLGQIDVGSWFAPEFADQRVPTLGEVLDRCRGRIGVNIELKYYGHDERLERRVSEIVDAHDMSDEVLFMSLKRRGVEKLQAIRPDAKVGLLLSVSAGNPKDFAVDFLAVNAAFADRTFIRRAHANGQEVYVWTVNDRASMSTMIGRGVDALLTDEPALARSVLEERAALSPPERLLLELAGLLGVEPRRGEP